MKRIVICCDGTSNKPDIDNVTNVVKVASGIADQGGGVQQIVFYDQGVGSDGLLDQLAGGVFGTGVTKNIREAYRFLVTNYIKGDEIYIFGFSRGAFTARSLSGLIDIYGILDRSQIHDIRRVIDLYRNKQGLPKDMTSGLEARIKFLGVWDTVGAMGIQLIRLVGTAGWWPGQLLRIPAALVLRSWKKTEVIPEYTRSIAKFGASGAVETLNWMRFWTKARHQFHNTTLAANVDNAYHAVSIDERRPIFEVVLWDDIAPVEENETAEETPDNNAVKQVMKQVWFSGVHTEIGGGNANVAASIRPLRWMAARAHESGLRFSDQFYEIIKSGYALPSSSISASPSSIYVLLGWLRRKIDERPSQNEAIHQSAIDRYNDSKAGRQRNKLYDSTLRLVGIVPQLRKDDLQYAPDNLVKVMEPHIKLGEEPEEPEQPGTPPAD
ncbi:MAG: DUF2235 domain-containing protein [Dehalococcoidia bacterium]